MSDAVLEKCVIVVSDELPPGRAANAAAVVALTLGGCIRASSDGPWQTPTAMCTRA